jgi:predicted nucleic acid-binding Zn ribbon protein
MERIETEVRRELGRFGPEAGLGEVVAAWPTAVGPEIARNAWPARIGRDGTLHVATGSSAWAYELTQLEEEVRARLRAPLGDAAPSRLRFAVGPLPAPGPEPGEEVRRTAPEVTARERAEGDRIAREIADSDLRQLVARAAAASLASARADRPL